MRDRVAFVEVDEHKAEMAAVEAGAKPKDCRSGGKHEYPSYHRARCRVCSKRNPKYDFWGPEDAVHRILNRGKARWLTAPAICKEAGYAHTPNGTYVAALRLAALGEIRAKRDGGTIVFRRKSR